MVGQCGGHFKTRSWETPLAPACHARTFLMWINEIADRNPYTGLAG
jgi:hypothetical protein